MPELETTTVMISKDAVKKAKIIGAHEDKTIRDIVEEGIDLKLSKSRSVPAETKAELTRN